MNRSDGGSDPAPRPPARPGLDDCCRSGCSPCVFDLYEAELERYRVELKAWQQRHDKVSNYTEATGHGIR